MGRSANFLLKRAGPGGLAWPLGKFGDAHDFGYPNISVDATNTRRSCDSTMRRGAHGGAPHNTRTDIPC